jgi:hypothetical protein
MRATDERASAAVDLDPTDHRQDCYVEDSLPGG